MAFFLVLASHMATSPSSNSNNCTIYQDKIIGSKRAFLRVTRSSVEECCSLCGNTAGCMSWNFESADRMTCYLQKDAGDIKDKQGAVSGLTPHPSPPTPSPPTPPHPSPTPPSPTPVEVELGTVFHTTDDDFYCWTIDASPDRGWEQRNLSDPMLHYLARHSQVGIIRFGGSGNDGLNYFLPCTSNKTRLGVDAGNGNLGSAAGSTIPAVNANNHCHVMNKSWATNLFELAAAAGGKLVFGLNINPRNASTGRWDPTQARGLIQFAQANGYSIYGFELGNEQNKAFDAPSEAADFKVLSELVNEMYQDKATQPKLIGPDPHGFHNADSVNQKAGTFLRDFAGNCSSLGVPLHAITHHEYVEVQQNLAQPPPASTLDLVYEIGIQVNATVRPALRQEQGIWVGESGPHNGGSPGVCPASEQRWMGFADSFWYMDAMASKAKAGYAAFCRQNFVGIDYALLQCDYSPAPDYYAGLLWGTLMGPGVVQTTVSNRNQNSTRIYAHCTAGTPGDLTMLLINLDPAATVNVTLHGAGAATNRTEYHLTAGPGGVGAGTVALNGAVLNLSSTGALPAMEGRPVVGSQGTLTLPPASIVFAVLHGTGAAAGCL